MVGLSEGYEPQPELTFVDFLLAVFPFLDGALDGDDDGLQLGKELKLGILEGIIDNEGMSLGLDDNDGLIDG